MSVASAPPAPPLRTLLGLPRRWPARRWLVAMLATAAAALLIGVPTGVVPTPIYTRMTTTWWNYPVWAVSALLAGLTAATYVRMPGVAPQPSLGAGRSISATVVSLFAVGCPICNKLVVALIGITGALNYFQPIQPVLGVAGIALLAIGLVIRLRAEAACSVRAPG